MRNESEFQSFYNRWKRHNMRVTCAEELKVVKRGNFLFSQLAPHQIANLYNAKHDCIQIKIPDLGIQNPFDSFSLCEVPAWVVVLFEKKYGQSIFYVIDIDKIKDAMNEGKKGFTEEECEEACNYKDFAKVSKLN